MDISQTAVLHPSTETANRATARPFYYGWRHGVCWKSIVAGTVAALSVQLVLTMIGAGVFAARFNPATDPTSTDGVAPAVLSAAWLIVSGMISFGIGGMIAGAASAGRDNAPAWEAHNKNGYNKDGLQHTGLHGGLHGMLAWSLAAVLGVLATTIAGSALAGTAGGAAAAAGSRSGNWSGWNIPAAGNGWRFADPTDRGTASSTADAGEQSVTVVGPYGQRRTITEPQARAMAERAASAASKAALATALAFAIAMAAATIGGGIGRSAALRRHEALA